MFELSIILWLAILATVIFGLRLAPRSNNGDRQLVSAHGLMMILFFVFIVLPASTPVFTSDGILYWAKSYSGYDNVVDGLLLVWFSLVAYLIGYQFFRPRDQRIDISRSIKLVLVSRFALVVIIGMYLIGMASKFALVTIGGGLEQTIMRMSAGVANNMGISRDGSGLIVVFRGLAGFADIAATCLFILALGHKRWRFFAFIILILTLLATIGVTGKRLYIFWPLIAMAVALSKFVFRIRSRHMLPIVLGVILFGWLTLFFRIYAPLNASGMIDSFDLRAVPWAQGSLWRFYFGSLEFAYFDLIVASIEGRDAIMSIFGGQFEMIYTTQIEPFLFIIPRIVWPDKPELFLDMAHGLAALVFFEDVATVDLGVASSLIGTSWVSGGLWGSAVAFVFMGIFCGWVDRFYFGAAPSVQESPLHILLFAFFLMVVFHLFRQGTFGWVFMITVAQQLGGLFSLVILWLALRVPVPRIHDGPKIGVLS